MEEDYRPPDDTSLKEGELSSPGDPPPPSARPTIGLWGEMLEHWGSRPTEPGEEGDFLAVYLPEYLEDS